MINCADIVDLDTLNITTDNIEQLGTKEKFWFQHPTYDMKCLFKISRESTGEHWSEVIADKICTIIGIPHAEYELAYITHYGEKKLGVFTKNIVPKNYEMVIGNQFLYQLVTNTLKQPYPQPLDSPTRFDKVKEYTVDSVLRSLELIEVLPEHQQISDRCLSACDIFCGYLLLDALISNQDRHHENWAVLQSNITGKQFICPTYDHASSLGAIVRDSEKRERLITNDKYRKIPAFTAKARSVLYKHPASSKRMTTKEAYFESTNHKCSSDDIREYWNDILRTRLTPEVIQSIINSIDDVIISPTSKEFAIAMIKENRSCILSA